MNNLKRTIKEQDFIKSYIDCKGNATKAYSRVFPHVKLNSAAELGSKLLKKLDIHIAELMDLMGMDDHVINDKLQAGLNATTIKTVGKGKDKKKITVPLYYVQAKYLDMILRVRAKYPIDETRLRLPGAGDGATSVILRELIYSKEGKKELKQDIKENRVKLQTAKSVDTEPF